MKTNKVIFGHNPSAFFIKYSYISAVPGGFTNLKLLDFPGKTKRSGKVFGSSVKEIE